MGDAQQEPEAIEPFIRLRNEEGTDDIYYSLFYEGIPNEFKAIAQAELNETEEKRRGGVLTLREFLRRQHMSDIDDGILISFLRHSEYSIERSKQKLIHFHKVYRSIIEWLQEVDIRRLENVLSNRFIGFLPYRDKHGRPILYTTVYDVDLESYDMEDAAYCIMCILLYALAYPLTSIAGFAFIVECKTISLSVLFSVMEEFSNTMPKIKTFPVRVTKIGVLNDSVIIRLTYSAITHLIPSRVTDRLQFYGSDIEQLQEVYHPDILPEEFGGTMGPINPKFFKEDFLKFIYRLKSRH